MDDLLVKLGDARVGADCMVVKFGPGLGQAGIKALNEDGIELDLPVTILGRTDAGTLVKNLRGVEVGVGTATAQEIFVLEHKNDAGKK